jgi:dipeptidyl aminopeptidase/acylaminoacyl peptidase
VSYLWYWPDGGWDFEEWCRGHSWEPVYSEQSGRSEPLPLVLDPLKPESAGEWERSAERWRRVSDEVLSAVSDRPPQTMRWEFLGEELTSTSRPVYSLRRLRYTLTEDEWGYAWLLVPRGARRPRAAVIALHQTSLSGKSEVIGLERSGPDDYMHYAVELAAEGFVVLAPDAIGFGERQAGHGNAYYRSARQFYEAHPEGSVVAKMVFDVSRAVDLLERLPEVDGARIGCIGHSHGGYGTLFAMAHEPRIEAGVISCGMNLLRDDPKAHRWWRQTALIPRLGFYKGRIEQTPMDFHHWLALVAPRPVMVVAGTDDEVFPNCAALSSRLELVRAVYELSGAGKNLEAWIFEGAHSFPPEARRQAYHTLAGVLM